MEKRPAALLLKFPGTDCEEETARALSVVGFHPEIVPFAALTADHVLLARLVVLPGGFSYGDYISAGRFAQLEIERKLGHTLSEFIVDGGYVLGICNGFQILSRLGILPTGSLVENVGRQFLCRWVTLKTMKTNSPYLTLLPPEFELPIAHGEGRFVSRPGLAARYVERGLVPLVYKDAVNGSEESIAALQDETGRVIGLMPHPERVLYREDYYDGDLNIDSPWGWGYYFFKSIYEAVTQTGHSARQIKEEIGALYR